jgi:hypothetical protein
VLSCYKPQVLSIRKQQVWNSYVGLFQHEVNVPFWKLNYVQTDLKAKYSINVKINSAVKRPTMLEKPVRWKELEKTW